MPFVKDRLEYITENPVFPTYRYVMSHLKDRIPANVEVLNLYPGDWFNFDRVVRSMYSGHLEDQRIIQKSVAYYTSYGIEKRCVTYRESEVEDGELE